MISLMEVVDKDELVIITNKGMVIRQAVRNIRVMGRNTQGVRVINLKDGDMIADIAKVITEDEHLNGNNNNSNNGAELPGLISEK